MAKLDVPQWGQQQSVDVLLEEECYKGDVTACDTLSREEEAKRAWLAKQDVPSWGPGSPAMAVDEDAAKRAWLAKLDVPQWGQQVNAVLEEECYKGDETACETLSREEEAKR